MKRLAILAAAAAVSACAKNPESIAPLVLPTTAYMHMDCKELNETYGRSARALTDVERTQRQAVTGDAVGVFLIGVPLSSLAGADNEGTVALRKGELLAIDQVQQNKGCTRGYSPNAA